MALKLQLARGDRILIGDEIIAEVLSTGRTMQLAISAPRDIKIVRIPVKVDDYAKNAKREAEGRPRGGSPQFGKS